MPYFRNVDLPDSVLQHLSKSAQDTYRRAFNTAWNNYQQVKKPEDNMSLEDVAHVVAWASLEENYHKTSRGQWVPD